MTEAQVISWPNDPSTAIVTTSPSIDRPDPILPPSITDQIIDNLCGNSDALRQCALTCRAWRPRSQLCLNHTVTIRSRAALKAFAAHLRDPCCLRNLHNLTISQRDSFRRGSTMDDQFVHLVPLVLPQVLESVKMVAIHYITWSQFPPHPTFRFLPTQFPHVVSLTLFICSFCSQKELFIVLSAFPSLSCLRLDGIHYTNTSLPSVLFTHPRMRARLRELFVGRVRKGVDGILEFLTRCPQCLETLRDLTLHNKYMSYGTDNAIMRKFSQVVGPSLESLSFWYIDHGVLIELLTTCTHLRFLSLKQPPIPLDTLVDQLASMASCELRGLYISIQTGDSNPEKMLSQWHRLDDVFMREQFKMLAAVNLQWEVRLKVKPAVLARKFLQQFPKLLSRGILEVDTYALFPVLVSAGPITSLDDSPESDCDSKEEDLEVSSEPSTGEWVKVWLKFCSN